MSVAAVDPTESRLESRVPRGRRTARDRCALHPASRLLLTRLGALAILLVVYEIMGWRELRHLLRQATSALLGLLGHATRSVDSGAELYLAVGGESWFEVNPACTYVDLFLILTPFAWRFGSAIGTNLIRIVALGVPLFVFDVLRVSGAIHLHRAGAPWLFVHDVPYVAGHVVAISVAVILALRSDRRL